VTLPIAISVPHAGLAVPELAADYCQLTPEQLAKDGDEGAREIYDLEGQVAAFATTDVARAIIDLNRAPEDRRPDGVVKAQTIWAEPVYRRPLPDHVIQTLLNQYYHPYHRRLSAWSQVDSLLFAVDCHTMVAVAPPIGPDPGSSRPEICLGDLHGRSLPKEWTLVLHHCFQDAFTGFRVTLNHPFSGGYITTLHSREMPWFQLEISRAGFLPAAQIRQRVREALSSACALLTASR
jgi:formiminoglutamase